MGADANAVIASYRDLQATQLACGLTRPAAAVQAEPGAACRARADRFHGRPAEAYGRWLADQVRELPAPSATASSAGD